MAKRVIIAVTVDDTDDVWGLVEQVDAYIGNDPTVWEYRDFWLDVADGVIGPRVDTTQDPDTALDELREKLS